MGIHPSRYRKCSFAILAFFITFVPAFLQAQRMKLLAPNTGWLIDVNRLLWTSDNGAHWTNITPHVDSLPRGASFGDVFFRDSAEGWAILSYKAHVEVHTFKDIKALQNAPTLYAVAHTQDSGKNWTAIPIVFPSAPTWMADAFAGVSIVYFIDSLHGWIAAGMEGNARTGQLSAIEDGGHTWKWAGINSDGPIFFHSVSDGWQISGWGDDLYETHDGARTWKKVQLATPLDLGNNLPMLSLDMPQFADEKHGYLPVTFSGAFSVPPVIVVYSTDSAGKDWHPFKTITVSRDTAFTLIDSTLIFVMPSGSGGLSLQKVSLTDRNPLKLLPSRNGVNSLSFVDTRNGWASTSTGLCATSDGGVTWKRISPPPLYTPTRPGVLITGGHVVGPPEKKPVYLCH